MLSSTRLWLTTLLLMCSIQGQAASEQWPAYQHDIHRSGYSAEKLQVERLHLSWTWRSPSPPQPAWAGPAKWDAFAGQRDLPAMRNYDMCFHPIAVAGRVFFGSSADNTLYCVDAMTGSQRWSFVTDGPIRISPTYAGGNVYFGSDDGFAYCLDASDGTLLWKYRPVEPGHLILNNGNFIPLHPCRTGVLVDNGRAYFGCALLPWEDAYLCSVDTETGQPNGNRCYVKQLPGATLEGAPAATSDLLVFPQGRVAPRVFRRQDGKDQGPLKKSSGGSIVVVSLDANLFHGPGADSKKGGVRSSSLETREVIASHGRGNALVVADDISYMLTDDLLTASDLLTRKNKWTIPCDQPFALIGVGDTLIAGGRDEVVAYRAKDGVRVWRGTVHGKAYGLAAANGQLMVSTDAGTVHAFSPDSPVVPMVQQPATSVPFAPLPVENVNQENLCGRWVFQQPYVAANQVRDLAGKIDGNIDGQVRLQTAGRFQALTLDGHSHSVMLAKDHTRAELPVGELTIEAWVRVDRPQEWGGIVGAVQDNGSYERGWILGFRNARFSFALAGKGGSGALTYLTANRDFERGRWHHVAGTYDGTKMRLFVGGQLENESAEQQGEINYPPTAFFEIGAYHDQDENFRLQGQIHEVRLYDKALGATELADHIKSKAGLPLNASEEAEALELASGPWLEFTDPTSAVVRWQSKEPRPTVLEYWFDGQRKTISHQTAVTDHRARLDDLRTNGVYRFVIREVHEGKDVATREFECDTFFNFTSPHVDTGASTSLAESVRTIIRTTRIDRGICLVLGSAKGQMALELARQTRLRVIAVDTDKDRVLASREILKAAGIYGSRITVRQVDDLSELPFVGHFANLVVSGAPMVTESSGTVAEILRVLRPDGGVAWFGSDPVSADRIRQWRNSGFEVLSESNESSTQLLVRRGALPGSGDWSHLYGRPDNSAFGGEQLVGVETADDLAVQWIGRPGPRFKPDRNGRKPSPLSTAGRLYVQGMQRIAALDAYNGTVLWSVEIPDLQRFNMPRDCGNWCADRDFVYVAVRDKCWQIDAAVGKVVKIHDVIPPAGSGVQFDWGAIVSLDQQLIGTAVKQGTSWTNFWGGANAGWYDARSGAVTDKICADNLFSMDKTTGQTKWWYSKGVVINSTVAVRDERVYFVECRNQEVIDAPERRIGNPKLWNDQYLVALDAYSGEILWERPIDTEDGKVVFYLAGAADRLVIVASADEQYHVYGFSTDGGERLWNQTFRWPGGKGDHGKAMSRPAIAGDRVFVRPHVFQLTDGRQLPTQMPGGGCGTYACSSRAIFFRASTITMWDPNTGKSNRWDRLRPDCWLSAIPAAGMLLCAEGAGGCSCGGWLETSVGFMPAGQR